MLFGWSAEIGCLSSLGQVAVHDRRLGALGGVVDRVGVLEPGGVAGQLGEAGVARGVEVARRSSTSVFAGSSSSSTTTIGACVTPPIVRALASSGKASSEIGPLNRNSARKTSGTGERTLRNERTGSAAAHSAARPAPIASDRTISTGSGSVERLLQRLGGDQRDQDGDQDQCAPRGARARPPARPAARSRAAASGGSTTSSTEKEMMSKPDEPRAAKNSGLSLSRSNSGWATAKVQSTARFR